MIQGQHKTKKKDEKYFRGLQIHFTMTLGKIYIFAGSCILQLRERERETEHLHI